jgi:branched-chain amino acid transport system ATP-binding protein
MKPLLSVQNICKSYGSLKVADNVSLDIADGETHAIIGPNGAGKTTFVSLLSGQLKQDSGRVFFQGADVSELRMSARLKAGMARSFQIPKLLPQFSALENVAIAVQVKDGHSFRFFGNASQEKPLNEKAVSHLENVGFDIDKKDELASNLSYGAQRQLELAMATASEPRLLLLDEPLAGTGRKEASVIIELIHRLKSRTTILMIEHDMDAVFSLADRVSVLVYGRIIATGSPDEIRNDAAVRAAYLGTEGKH